MAGEEIHTLTVERGGQKLHVEVEGPDKAPAVLLMHSLGSALALWDPQMAALKSRFKVVRFDTRGHGKSSIPDKPASVAELGEDALAILDALGLAKVRVAGLSMGGQIALWLAEQHPERVSHALIANSAALIGTHSVWNERIVQVTKGGMSAVVDATMARWLKDETRAANGRTLTRMRAMLLATDPKGYTACCAVVRDADLRADLGKVRCPVLVISGAKDSASPAESGREMTDAIPNARFLVLDAAHVSNWEEADRFTDAMVRFLAVAPPDSDRYDLGMAMRRQVLGDAWVDRIQLNAFNQDYQEWITRTVWGENWQRPGLEPAVRSPMIMGMMIALGRWEEFRVHVRAAFNNGLDMETIKETILLAGIYCGVPAANSAMHHAQEVLKAIGKLN